MSVEEIVSCMTKNKAHALAFRECLVACEVERPYREIEAELEMSKVFSSCTQSPHTLIGLLVEHGAIEKTIVEEEGFAKKDQPVDYKLRTTEEGLRAAGILDPAVQLERLVNGQVEEVADLYRKVLKACDGGASLGDVKREVGASVVLPEGKTVYAEYFVSKLETAGGLMWDGKWRTTKVGSLFVRPGIAVLQSR